MQCLGIPQTLHPLFITTGETKNGHKETHFCKALG